MLSLRLIGMYKFLAIGSNHMFGVVITIAALLTAFGGRAGAAETLPMTHALETPYAVPEIDGIAGWINSKPLRLADWRGKVVLVDFWTYSCINCLRTLPYITGWYNKYHTQGLEIIGIHAPEFAFEKKSENVQKAVQRFGIHYPVALDNELTTWANFKNQYWPAHYLIDRQGRVVYTHFGEGQYDVTENNIRALLGMAEKVAVPVVLTSEPQSFAPSPTHETYLGYRRAENFSNSGEAKMDVPGTYMFPEALPLHRWALSGSWHIGAESIRAAAPGAALRLHFAARKVFLVLGSTTGSAVMARILLNGKPLANMEGVDGRDGMLTVDHDKLYTLLDQGMAQEGVLEIQAMTPGLQAYAFTFGN